MKTLFIGSVTEYAGKRMVTLGLGDRFKRDGRNLAYFKYLGRDPIVVDDRVTDEDAILFKKYLDLDESLEDICPVVLNHDFRMKAYRGEDNGAAARIIETFERIGRGRDLVMVGGAGNFFEGGFIGMSGWDFIHKTGAAVILVDKFETDYSVDNILAVNSNLEPERFIGVILNQVNENKIDYLERIALPLLERKGVRTLGVIPRDALLGAVTVGEIAECLAAEVLCCSDKMDSLVENFDVGAMNVDAALKHFRKTRNKAVITGGDRADIQIAALDTSTTALILTGGLYPNARIVGSAEDKGVPVLVVHDDTLTAVEKLAGVLDRMRLNEGRKARRAVELVDRFVDFEAIYAALAAK